MPFMFDFGLVVYEALQAVKIIKYKAKEVAAALNTTAQRDAGPGATLRQPKPPRAIPNICISARKCVRGRMAWLRRPIRMVAGE
jgi:hypothetical protein